MPVSIKTAANYFCRDQFAYWNPTADRFDGEFYGRVRRIDNFVSLWHRSSRRQHIYLRSDADFQDTGVFKHISSGKLWLISQSQESDDWQGAGTYTKMVRAHSLGSPSGAKSQFYPVSVSGTGDNLGAVTVGPAQLAYVDIELRTTTHADDAIEVVVGEYLAAYSRNITASEGDYFYHNGSWYLVLEPYGDSGFNYCRTINQDPGYVTATFTKATTSTFDPETGTFSTGTKTTRQVSVLIGETMTNGRPTDNDLAEQLTLYVYRRHIGFVPEVGMLLTLLNKPYKVIKVLKANENKQYELVVAP